MAMALRGDDEVASLLDLMGSGSGSGGGTPGGPSPPSSSSSSSAAATATATQAESAPAPAKKRKRKSKRRHSKGDVRERKKKKADGGGGGAKPLSFVDTRLDQDCLAWPPGCGDGDGDGDDDDGPRLVLGGALAPDRRRGGGDSAGSARVQSAASRELLLRPPAGGDVADGAAIAARCHPLSIASLASAIVATRNARCLIGEHHPTSAAAPSRERSRDGGGSTIVPPLNSVPSDPAVLSDALDVYTGRILLTVRSMHDELLRPKRRSRNDGHAPNAFGMLGSAPSLTKGDVRSLREKASAVAGAVREYQKSMSRLDLDPSERRAGEKEDIKKAAVELVESRLVAMAACDDLYHRCYYAAAVSPVAAARDDDDVGGGAAAMAAIVPHPATYFSCPGLARDVRGGEEALRRFLGEEGDDDDDAATKDLAAPLSDRARRSLKSWGLVDRLANGGGSGDQRERNPLLVLWRSRFAETVRHVWCTGYGRARSPRALRERHKSNGASSGEDDALLRVHDTVPLSPAVGRWRDSVRDYPANFYAYATPTEDAFNAVSDGLVSPPGMVSPPGVGRVVEAGAGTGYWSALLRSHLDRRTRSGGGVSVPVVAYDVAPPPSPAAADDDGGRDGGVGRNEYHGNMPAFAKVHRADSLGEALSASSQHCPNTALLLCYPPPGSDMAERALAAHLSHDDCTAVIHVGEWGGLTGDPNSESLLTRHFRCGRGDVVELPSWGTDAAYLSVWRRRGRGDGSSDDSEDRSRSPGIGYCSVPSCSERARRRCRFARRLQYCDAECFAKHSPERTSELALQMIHVAPGNDVRYDDDCHFMDLDLGPSTARSKGGRKKKKRRRKSKKNEGRSDV